MTSKGTPEKRDAKGSPEKRSTKGSSEKHQKPIDWTDWINKENEQDDTFKNELKALPQDKYLPDNFDLETHKKETMESYKKAIQIATSMSKGDSKNKYINL